jgi:hypothetical protein
VITRRAIFQAVREVVDDWEAGLKAWRGVVAADRVNDLAGQLAVDRCE